MHSVMFSIIISVVCFNLIRRFNFFILSLYRFYYDKYILLHCPSISDYTTCVSYNVCQINIHVKGKKGGC